MVADGIRTLDLEGIGGVRGVIVDEVGESGNSASQGYCEDLKASDRDTKKCKLRRLVGGAR